MFTFTPESAAFIGNFIGILLRTFGPFLISVWKGHQKLTDWDSKFLAPALWMFMAGTPAQMYGIPEGLARIGVPMAEPWVPYLLLWLCAMVAYVGQDKVREIMRSKDEEGQ